MSCFVRDVDAARNVVEQHHVAVGEQPAADQHLLLVAARERAHLLRRSAAGSGSGGGRRSPRRAATRGGGGGRRARRCAAGSRASGCRGRTSAAAVPRSCGPRGRARCRGRPGSRRRGAGSACASPPTRISPPVAFRAPKSVMKSSRWPWPARPPMPRISPRRSSSEKPFTPGDDQVAHLERHAARRPAPAADRGRCGRSCGRSSASPPRSRRSTRASPRTRRCGRR